MTNNFIKVVVSKRTRTKLAKMQYLATLLYCVWGLNIASGPVVVDGAVGKMAACHASGTG
jgi:hypothetical protein